MKLQLCRHKLDKFFDLFGYGYVIQDFGYKVRIRWIQSQTKWDEHTLHRRAVIFLEQE